MTAALRIAEVADTLADRLESGIPEADLVAAAKAAGVWPFEVMEALGAALVEDRVFKPWVKRVVVVQPEPEPEPVEPARARLAPPTAAKSKRAVRTLPATTDAPRGPTVRGAWTDRLATLDEAPPGDVVITFERMIELGWPIGATKYPTIWSTGNEPGRVARQKGFTPRFRDGVGVIFRR